MPSAPSAVAVVSTLEAGFYNRLKERSNRLFCRGNAHHCSTSGTVNSHNRQEHQCKRSHGVFFSWFHYSSCFCEKKKFHVNRGTAPLEIEDYDDSSCLPGVHVRSTPIYESGTCRQTMFLMFMLPAFSIRLPKAAATMHTFTTGINDHVNGQLCNTLKKVLNSEL